MSERIEVLGGKACFAERDLKIRSGLCPNEHGRMHPIEGGQQCPACGFWCNTHADLPTHKRMAPAQAVQP